MFIFWKVKEISVVAECGASGASGCCVIQPSYQWMKLKIYSVLLLADMLNAAMCL